MSLSLIIQLLIAVVSTGLVPFIVKLVIDSRIDNKLKDGFEDFKTSHCDVKHKEVDSIKADLKELKEDVRVMSLSLGKIQTTIDIYVQFLLKRGDKNDSNT